MAAGISSGPTPWWQMPGNNTRGAVSNLETSAPAGYTYDKVQQKYVRNVDTASKAEELQNLGVGQEKELFGKMMGAVNGIQANGGNSFGTGALSGSPVPPVVMGDGGAGAGGGTGALDAASAAQGAAFGKAKATAGALGRSANTSMRAEMADRGILGSGVEGRNLVRQLGEATNPLSDINAAGLHENVGITQHNQDLQQQRATTQYEGGITQRGQDVQQQEAASSNELARESLATQKQLALQQMLNQALGGIMGKINFNMSY